MVDIKKNILSTKIQYVRTLIILVIFIILGVLEYSTPSEYVFGYLYSGAILLVNSWFGERATVQATFVAVLLTILNVWLPGNAAMKISVFASRFIAAMALIVTGFLSQRLRRSQEAIALTKTKLESQEKLARLREDFASTLTHDLKTPLLGAIETIKAFQKEQFGAVLPTQQPILATMARSHETSLQLLETLLDIYRNDTEGLKLNLAPVDLTFLAEEVSMTLTQLAASRRVHLSFNYGDSDFRRSLWVNGDALQLQRVFTNLLVNAINHSRRGDRVEIVLAPQASYQVVKILDTGAGILPEHFPYLFERFYQGHSDRQAKGSGLGLYLSRQIIAAHDGIIWAENRVPTGAIFSFKLPVLPVSAE
ncbi:sensor histidine kinase [Anabaena sp. CCY 9402-a]|uniref:sensor histidine kinase n=1 Tax=Anabaena sp. CCY 9402-a TaxID=3103867 RepID=UPI0039C73860